MESARPVRPVIRVVAALVEREQSYLITQRRAEAVLPSLWEFPGGRVERGEEDAAALRREMEHRVGVSVEVLELVSFISHPYERYTVDLYLYRCRIEKGTPENRAVASHRWVKSHEFEAFAFTPADEASMTQLLGLHF